jgi:hypothetical protein
MQDFSSVFKNKLAYRDFRCSVNEPFLCFYFLSHLLSFSLLLRHSLSLSPCLSFSLTSSLLLLFCLSLSLSYFVFPSLFLLLRLSLTSSLSYFITLSLSIFKLYLSLFLYLSVFSFSHSSLILSSSSVFFFPSFSIFHYFCKFISWFSYSVLILCLCLLCLPLLSHSVYVPRFCFYFSISLCSLFLYSNSGFVYFSIYSVFFCLFLMTFFTFFPHNHTLSLFLPHLSLPLSLYSLYPVSFSLSFLH